MLKKDKGIKDNVINDIKTLYESKYDCYKPIGTFSNAFSINYIEYESTITIEYHIGKDKTLLVDDYLDKVKTFLNLFIDNHKTQSEWNIQLKIATNFISSKDSEETRDMHTSGITVTVVLNPKQIKSHPERISNIKPLIY